MECTIKATRGTKGPEAHIAMIRNVMDDFTRSKSLNDKLIDENRRLTKENDELKEKLVDQKKLIDTMAAAIRANDFLSALENWLKSN